MSVETTLSLLQSRMARLEPGHVWLAGAGPGDPGCLTLDVVSALTQADVVVYDALVDPAVVAIAEGAELFFVGKRGGKLSITQAEITARLIELAKAGRKVLRLKGGDPYVFGRGGEEAIALAREGIPFRYLPGITSGLAALGNIGIAPTMRGLNKAVILATGQTADLGDELDWRALAATGQPIVIYMGLKILAHITGELMAGGLPADTPAAIVMAATTPRQRVHAATLGAIAGDAERLGFESPVLTAVGRIVSMRAELLALADRALK
ncbi:uroporphyrin-III C-methyltransferase [Mesorhizobium albiziae]|uniref:uroporphyrinogen-III C-methyltransferase n=1 Tax=Neomesorhizobium albiziae TaxID=335020 RepID=A0A1I3WA61_9HYPH|nr:uroporphyrinogen-III C-methyltransferase [Mesorhizobium albiziae]GLS31467.1 uroporphyrin-III C-methyltransferase [Mesorhizobium albiziae]SFK04290.1 uroporphyrin-III C-methyltransferase [Mesorhizobium albiziae]